MAKDKFMFFPNFKAIAEKLDDTLRLKFYDALTDYVFSDKEPDDPIISALLEAIKPSLDKVDGRQNNGGNHNPNGVNQHTKVGQSGQIRSKLVNSGQFSSETETETEEETEVKEKELSDDNSKKKFTEDSIIAVNGQYFDEFPSECMPLLKKYWSVSEIEEIRKNLACQPNHETTIAKLLEHYPPKQKQEDRTLEIQFNTFWEVYPKQRKAGKTKPREKFFQIVKSGKATAEQIIKSAEDYAKTDEVARGFAKEPYSWLLNERYLCDYTIKQTVQTPMTAKERIDMINKQKTEMLLKQLKAQGN